MNGLTEVDLVRSYADLVTADTGSCVLASHQPDFFPYMGYFYKIFQSDLWVFTDDVLFSKKGRHNYNDILTSEGPHRFTLPIHYHLEKLNEIKVAADDKTVNKMVKTLWMEYHGAEHFHEAFPVLEELILSAPRSTSLAAFNQECILQLAEKFGLCQDRFFLTSSRDVPTEKRRDERIIWICQTLHANVYYSGVGAKDYHIEQEYADGGIQLIYSDYQPVEYPQVGIRTAENMSVIDYVLNCGFNLPRGWKKRV